MGDRQQPIAVMNGIVNRQMYFEMVQIRLVCEKQYVLAFSSFRDYGFMIVYHLRRGLTVGAVLYHDTKTQTPLPPAVVYWTSVLVSILLNKPTYQSGQLN